VDFFVGASLLGTVTPVATNLVSLTWSNVPTGNYLLTAKATDNSGAMTVSQPVSITVTNVQAMSPSCVILAIRRFPKWQSICLNSG
jgi:hypothetical protein